MTMISMTNGTMAAPITPPVTGSTGSKRPVAKHACLACREKKVKCDGELPTQTGAKGAQIQHQRCTNCKVLSIDCVFVPSQRGGRRKRDSSNSGNGGNNSANRPSHKEFNQNSKYGQTLSSGPSDNPAEQARATSYDESIPVSPTNSRYSEAAEPPNIGSTVTSPFYNNGGHSPTLAPNERESSQNTYLHEKVRQLQRVAANIQSQLSAGNESSCSNSDFYESRRHSKTNESESTFGRSYKDRVNPPQPPPGTYWDDSYDDRCRRHQHHYSPPPPPPPGPGAFDNGLHYQQHHNPPPHHMQGHHPPPPPCHHDGPPPLLGHRGTLPPHPYGHPFPPPPPPPPPPAPGPHGGYHPYTQHFSPPLPQPQGQSGPLPPPSNFEEEEQDEEIHARNPKRGNSFEADKSTLPKLSKPANVISISDAELDMFDLPNWRTTCTLIDLYYRYIHPSRTFLPPKHRLIYQIQIRQDASLLHAMFSCSSRFASASAIPNPNLRDPQHWYFLAEKYWDLLSLENSLQALVLLMGALGPGGYIQQSIEGSERFNKLLRVNNVMPTLKINDWSEFAEVATKRQVIRHEDMIRTIWSSWRLNVLIRINRGFPFSRISNNLLQFLPDLSFPSSDSHFNLNLSIFDSNDNAVLKSLHYKDYGAIQKELEKAERDPSLFKNFSDSNLQIIAIKQMEDIMDSISQGYLNSTTCANFNKKIEFIEQVVNSSLYHISHIKKKMVILSISRTFSLFILNVARLVLNVSQCAQILLIKPHETGSSSDPDDVFNSLYESKLEDIHEACLNLTPDQIYNYVYTFAAALESVRLLEIGHGIIPEVSQSSVPVQVVGGPLNFAPASEISSLRSHENWCSDAIQEPGKTMAAQAETFNEFPDVWLQYPISSIVVMANALTVLSSSTVLTKILSFRESGSSKPGFKDVEFIVDNGKKIIPAQLEDNVFSTFKNNFHIGDLKRKSALVSRFIQAHGRFWPYVESISNQSEAIINYVDDVISRMN